MNVSCIHAVRLYIERVVGGIGNRSLLQGEARANRAKKLIHGPRDD